MKSFVTPNHQTPSKSKTFFDMSKKYMLNHPFFQPKLAVGPVDDAYEREADAVADQVMRMPDNQVFPTPIPPVVPQRGSDPTIQRLAVTTKPFYSDKICGEREVKWAFALDNPASADGYMVQKIETYEIISDGCPGISGPPAPTQTFWEAFPVMGKDKYPMLHPTLGYSDRSYIKAYPNSKGTNTSFGTIKFFLKSTTGDLGGYMTPPKSKDSAWGPGKVPESGKMPSTPNEPAWWNSTPVEGPETRYATSQWDCCTDPATNNVTAFP